MQFESEKSQGTSLQREIQTLQESDVELQKKTERMQHDLGSKESQNMWLQGQLEKKSKQMEDMAARLKRTEREREELENAAVPMTAPAFCTPQKGNRPKSSSGKERRSESKGILHSCLPGISCTERERGL